MRMTGLRVADRMRVAAARAFVGRDAELALVESMITEDARPVVFVHGIGGVGKTSLLGALATRLRERGATVIRLDGRDFEPSKAGAFTALGAALGKSVLDEAEAAAVLEASEGTFVVVLVDEYDSLRLLDAWLRHEMAPRLSSRVHLVLAGRSRPVAAWTAALEWQGLVGALELGPLRADDARRLLAAESVPENSVARLVSLTGGHPLALRLASAAIASRPDLPLAEIESRHVVTALVQRFLRDVKDDGARAAVEAASVVRRVSRPLLTHLLGEGADFDALARVPWVEQGADGLVIHQSVRAAVTASLRSTDPERHRTLRTRAWEFLSREIRETGGTRGWRLIADVIYLADEPILREAFFPSDVIAHTVEPARPDDGRAMLAAAREHLGPEEERVLSRWWKELPRAFTAVRDEGNRLVGFHVFTLASEVPRVLREEDPLLRAWLADISQRVEPGRPVVVHRATLSLVHGEGQSAERASSFLDIKRSYLAHLDLRAVYAVTRSPHCFPLLSHIGFVSRTDLSLREPGFEPSQSLVLDLGKGVFDWLARLIDAQEARPSTASTPSPDGTVLDRATRELVVGGTRQPLTRLEYGVLVQLLDHDGAVVSREHLLETVWGQIHTGSNVVDVVVRSLRKKLGTDTPRLQTVTGFGYKFV